MAIYAQVSVYFWLQIRAARLRHPCCGQATVAAAKKKPHSTRGPGTKGIHGAATGAICVSLVRPFYDRLRAARWRAVIRCAISRAASRQDIESTVSFYRSEFLDRVARAGSE